MIDVVGVVTSVVHDKNVFVHGGITETVTFNLNDESTTFLCELYGDYVQEFRNLLKSSSDGLPILVLQFVELAMSRGNRLVKSIKNVTRMFFSPATVVDVLISFDPWWYPICKCHRIFDIYWENLLLLQRSN
ncbi:hypothetical protein P8452_32682 [Trifolium repens]|nr:hypothetical protein P8452_32682 [Trifolium repens]